VRLSPHCSSDSRKYSDVNFAERSTHMSCPEVLARVTIRSAKLEDLVKTRLVFVALLSFALALPAFAVGNKTYTTTYPVPCSEVWGAVKVALSNPENYKDVQSDEDKMAANYNVKHSLHWSITGAVNQGKNSVTLSPIGASCEMSVVSMFSGFSHNDQGDFKKRVDEALTKVKNAPPSQPAKPEDLADDPAK
jgi:hypothetical protein